MPANYKPNGSLKYQFKRVLQLGFTPGRSRHRDKQWGLNGNYIYAINSMKTYMNVLAIFSEFIRENFKDIRSVDQITPEIASAFIQHGIDRGNTSNTISKKKSAIRKFECIARRRKIITKNSPPLLNYRSSPSISGIRYDTRSYSNEEAHIIHLYAAKKDPALALAVEIQWKAGLRISEVVYLRADNIDFQKLSICLEGKKNHCKGGKSRIVTLTEEERSLLERLSRSDKKSEDGHIFEKRMKLGSSIGRIVRQACDGNGIEPLGTHGLRKTFAVNDFLRNMKSGRTIDEALLRTSRQLGHNRINVVLHSYIAPEFIPPEYFDHQKNTS
jgi:integrase